MTIDIEQLDTVLRQFAIPGRVISIIRDLDKELAEAIRERDEARDEILRMREAAAKLAGHFDDRGDYWTARTGGYNSAYESGMAEAFYYAVGKVENTFNQ